MAVGKPPFVTVEFKTRTVCCPNYMKSSLGNLASLLYARKLSGGYSTLEDVPVLSPLVATADRLEGVLIGDERFVLPPHK